MQGDGPPPPGPAWGTPPEPVEPNSTVPPWGSPDGELIPPWGTPPAADPAPRTLGSVLRSKTLWGWVGGIALVAAGVATSDTGTVSYDSLVVGECLQVSDSSNLSDH